MKCLKFITTSRSHFKFNQVLRLASRFVWTHLLLVQFPCDLSKPFTWTWDWTYVILEMHTLKVSSKSFIYAFRYLIHVYGPTNKCLTNRESNQLFQAGMAHFNKKHLPQPSTVLQM